MSVFFSHSCSIQFDSVRCFQPCSLFRDSVHVQEKLQASAGVSEQKDLWPIPCRRGFVFRPIAERFFVFLHLGNCAFQRLFWRSASSWQRGSRTAYSLLMPQSSSGPLSGALEFRSSGLLPGSARRLTTKVWRDIMACLSKPCLQTLAL